jgi:site-specific DNA recombinase
VKRGPCQPNSDKPLQTHDAVTHNTYVAYLRDSGGDTQDLSTAEQAIAVQRWCVERGHTLLTVYIDDASPGSSIVGRLQFQSMIKDLRANRWPGCAGVIIWSYSRFSRDIDDAQYFKSDLRRRGYAIISLTDNVPEGSMGRFIESAIDWQNQAYIERLSVDVRRGLYHLVETIGAGPGIPPRGFIRTPLALPARRDGQPHIVHRWDPDPAYIERIRQAFILRASGASYATIGKATGLYHNKNSWLHFFANPLYKGELRYGDLVISNYCEPIVDPALWQTVQGIPKPQPSTTERHPRRQHSDYLLSGLLRCPCGAAMSGTAITTSTKSWKKRYYICTRKTRTHSADCQARLIPAEPLERQLIDHLTEHILTLLGQRQIATEALANTSTLLPDLTAQRDLAVQRLTETRRQVSNTTDAIVMAGGSAALVKRLKELETEQAAIERDLADLNTAIADLANAPTDEQLERAIKQMRSVLQTGDTDLIRSIIKRLVAHLTAERIDATTIQIHIQYYLCTSVSHRTGLDHTQNLTAA